MGRVAELLIETVIESTVELVELSEEVMDSDLVLLPESVVSKKLLIDAVSVDA